MSRHFDGFWLRTPFTSCVIGPSKSGKSLLTNELVKHWDWISCGAKIDRLVLMFDCWQPIYDTLLQSVPDTVEVVLKQGFPVQELRNDKLFKKAQPDSTTLIIIDDLSTEIENNKEVRNSISRLFRVLSHHR